MATIRNASTHWEGSLRDGLGRVTFETSSIGTYEVTWPSRAEDPNGRTSPEELIAAAHSACYSMALAHALTESGTPPRSLDTRAEVAFTPGKGITGIVLHVMADVPGIDPDAFDIKANEAKNGCPVSQALAGTHITLEAKLVA